MTVTAEHDTVNAQPPGRAGLVLAIRSEWTKFWSVRSTPWSLFALLVATIGLGAASTAPLRSQQFGSGSFDDPIRRVLVGFNLGQFAIGVLGAMFLSAEFGTGQIRSTLAAQPRRSVVVGAKAIVMGAVGLVVGEILAFATFFVGQAILSGSNTQIAFSDRGVIRVLIESGVYIGLLGLIGLGVASIVRNTAGSIAVFAGVILILTLIVGSLPQGFINAVDRYLPANIGATVFSVSTPGRLNNIPVFSPLTGLFILALYAAILLVTGTYLMSRRDT
jgi:ABC-2 type transport system permease protein